MTLVNYPEPGQPDFHSRRPMERLRWSKVPQMRVTPPGAGPRMDARQIMGGKSCNFDKATDTLRPSNRKYRRNDNKKSARSAGI